MIKRLRDDYAYMEEHPEYAEFIMRYYGKMYGQMIYWTVRGWVYIWIVSVILERIFLNECS